MIQFPLITTDDSQKAAPVRDMREAELCYESSSQSR